MRKNLCKSRKLLSTKETIQPSFGNILAKILTVLPSKDVIETNVAKREKLIEERDKMQKEVDSLE